MATEAYIGYAQRVPKRPTQQMGLFQRPAKEDAPVKAVIMAGVSDALASADANVPSP